MERQLENQKKDCNVDQRKKGQYCSHIKLYFKFEVIKKKPKNPLENGPKYHRLFTVKDIKMALQHGKVCAVLELEKWE